MKLSDWEQKLSKAPFYAQGYLVNAFIFERDVVKKLMSEKCLEYAVAERELASKGFILSEQRTEIVDFYLDKNKDTSSELCMATEMAFAQFDKKSVEKICFPNADFSFGQFLSWPRSQFDDLAKKFKKVTQFLLRIIALVLNLVMLLSFFMMLGKIGLFRESILLLVLSVVMLILVRLGRIMLLRLLNLAVELFW